MRLRKRKRLIPTTQETIQAMLRKVGFTNIITWYQQGYYRQADGARWGGHGTAPEGFPQSFDTQFFSWDTMTECSRKGFALFETEYAWQYEIHALSQCTEEYLKNAVLIQQRLSAAEIRLLF